MHEIGLQEKFFFFEKKFPRSRVFRLFEGFFRALFQKAGLSSVRQPAEESRIWLE